MKIDGYKFGQKNNWRKWAWNRAKEIISQGGVLPKNANIMYLAGMQDLDRAVATSKGFNPNNMIAVDINSRVVNHAREKKCLAVKSDLNSAIAAISLLNKKIDVLVCDLCCGLTTQIKELIDLLSRGCIYNENTMLNSYPLSDSAAIIINLLRGRDAGEVLDLYAGIQDRHRGKMVYSYYVRMLRQTTEKDIIKHHGSRDNFVSFCKNCGMGDGKNFEGLLDYWIQRTTIGERFCFNSYSTNNAKMDSVVFKYLSPINGACPETKKEITEAKRSIASVFAIQTMKKAGKLKPCPAF